MAHLREKGWPPPQDRRAAPPRSGRQPTGVLWPLVVWASSWSCKYRACAHCVHQWRGRLVVVELGGRSQICLSDEIQMARNSNSLGHFTCTSRGRLQPTLCQKYPLHNEPFECPTQRAQPGELHSTLLGKIQTLATRLRPRVHQRLLQVHSIGHTTAPVGSRRSQVQLALFGSIAGCSSFH